MGVAYLRPSPGDGTYIGSEDLHPSGFLLPPGVLEAERHPLLVRVPPLHLVPLEGDHLVLERGKDRSPDGRPAHSHPLPAPPPLAHLLLPLLRTGEEFEVLDADGGDDVALPARVAGTVREHDLVVAFAAPQHVQVLRGRGDRVIYTPPLPHPRLS